MMSAAASVNQDSTDREPRSEDTQERLSDSAWLLEYFEEDLFKAYPSSRQDVENPKSHLVISFAALHRMRLRKLQIQLVNRVMTMHFKREEPSDWEDLLKEYITAQRDYKYIRECSDGNTRDPFLFTSAGWLEGVFLGRELDKVTPQDREKKGEWVGVGLSDFIYDDDSEDTRGRMNAKEKTLNLIHRLAMAVFGGAFLIGPMWLMVLRDDVYTTLITATAFVVGFGLIISIGPAFISGFRINVDTVMSVTAAYAAVLVVFVGTTAPTVSV